VQYPKVSIEDKKRQYGTSLFAAEMLNKPVDETTQEFKKKYFNTITFEELKKMQTRLFVTVDTALSKKDEADFTGIAMNWVNKENKWHLKAYQRKLNAKEIVYLIFDLHEMYHPEAFYIEEGAWLLAVKPFFDDECRKRNVFPPVRGIKHHGQHKETRIRGLVPRYETNSIYHLEGECVDLEDQLLRFPRAPHDDVSDALAYQIQVAKPPQEETYEEIVEEEPVYPDIGL
jgi:phage terminase large subunit-like protein